MNRLIPFLFVSFIFSCSNKVETIKPVEQNISESIYASGTIKSKDQYAVFARVSGIIDEIFVEAGDTVFRGMPILSIYNEAQRLNKENALLSANFYDFNANQEKLEEAKWQIELAKTKLQNDSIMFVRQKNLFDQGLASSVEFEQSELSYQNSKTAYVSAKVRYDELRRQLDYNSAQSKKNLLLSGIAANDYTILSELDGIVYGINKLKGEMITPQTELAIIGNAKRFVLEMQVDEDDILKITLGLKVLVTLDSYADQVFEARVTKINPLMNERSKTFLIEAEFVVQPERLYPNMNFEASIVYKSKEKALLLPRNYVVNDSIVTKANGEKVIVKTGLKDYQMIEIISGITLNDELILPTE